MTERVKTALQLLGGVLVFGLLAWAVIQGVKEAPAIVGSFATAVSAVLAVVIGSERQKRLDLQREHREVMTPIYAEFVERVVKDESRETAQAFYRDLNRKLLLRGSAPVVKAMIRWKNQPGETVNMLEWERLLRALRKDLGFQDRSLGEGDLLKVYIDNDQIDRLLLNRSPTA